MASTTEITRPNLTATLVKRAWQENRRFDQAAKDAAAAKPEAKTPKAKTPKWQPLDADTAAWVAVHARPATSPCLCGCGNETKGRFFPGHDATLKMKLQASLQSDNSDVVQNATVALAKFGW